MTFHHHHGLDRCTWCEDRHGLWSAFILGIAMLALGVVLILDNFGTINGSVLVPYWPILLMAFGLSQLLQPPAVRRVICGLTWVAVGAIILMNNLGVIVFGRRELWPLVLLIIGANLLDRGSRHRQRGMEAPRYRGPLGRREIGKETRHESEK